MSFNYCLAQLLEYERSHKVLKCKECVFYNSCERREWQDDNEVRKQTNSGKKYNG